MSHLKSGRLLVLALGFALLVASGAQSAPKKTKAASPYAAQITALHQVRALLAQADHDYKGHRVKAMHQIHAAVHALKVGTKAPKNPLKIVKGTGGLPQAESDVMLNKALGQIKTIQGQLSSDDVRGAAALSSLETAVKELNTALAIK